MNRMNSRDKGDHCRFSRTIPPAPLVLVHLGAALAGFQNGYRSLRWLLAGKDAARADSKTDSAGFAGGGEGRCAYGLFINYKLARRSAWT
ncbi:hypothetical protein [Paenibacillus nasutitermitis]|uniref:hypothetical protein n=1 Tax=Paenibacillus nasutitermitis TaxID=1652958 RepID=UPI001667CFA2|nr:hypothetical protein [Paenibacillus nasutitermitis]